ncbi:hypothetical protein M9Y10_034585 [Tritrichomonas musculus]|uniref:Kelch motif family protein n=1 Tax=Tritrichomonas musculus TaxID=1915356 RepID=A0ABR2KG58_9EUKA
MGNNQSEEYPKPFLDSNNFYTMHSGINSESRDMSNHNQFSGNNGSFIKQSSDYIPTPLLKTMYHGVWSMVYPDSVPPLTRVGQCHVYDEEKNTIIIAYGCGIDGKCLNDAWALDLKSLTWRCISRKLRSPRQYASAVLIKKRMFIFGGICDCQFFADLHYIDIDTGEVVVVNTEGEIPSPRTSPIFFCNSAKDTLFLWSGYTFDGLSDESAEFVSSLDLTMDTLQWQHFGQSFPGRASASYCCHNSNHYIFGSTNTTGLLAFSEQTGDFKTINCTGSEPQPDLNHTSMISTDEYIFLIGGEATFNYMHLFALDVKRKWWFAFHVRPDGESFATSDGIVNKLGLFMMPREFGASVVYNKEKREIVSVMGSRMMDPPPIFKIYIGEALGSIHMRSDMYEMFKRDISSF